MTEEFVAEQVHRIEERIIEIRWARIADRKLAERVLKTLNAARAQWTDDRRPVIGDEPIRRDAIDWGEWLHRYHVDIDEASEELDDPRAVHRLRQELRWAWQAVVKFYVRARSAFYVVEGCEECEAYLAEFQDQFSSRERASTGAQDSSSSRERERERYNKIVREGEVGEAASPALARARTRGRVR